jgi:Flp pilus assembly pilin Flp
MTHLLVRAFLALRYREEGQTLLEYGLIISLVSIGSILLLQAVGAFSPSVFTKVTSDL